MLRFFKQINFFIFFGILAFLTVFYIPREYYTEWFISFIFMLFFIIFISFKIFPSKKQEKQFLEIVEQYKKILKIQEDIRSESLTLEFTCPECKTKNTFWSFLEDYKCPKCTSGLWTTSIKDMESNYQSLFDKREKIYNFTEKLSSKTRNKLKNIDLNGLK